MKSSSRTLRVLLPLALCLGAVGCHSPFEGKPYRYDPGPPGKITGIKAEAGDGLVTLSWTPDAPSTSYDIYYASALTQDEVTRASGTLISVTASSHVVSGLDNNVPYYFIVVGHNGHHGEGPVPDEQVAATPGPATKADLVGTWYFHTLVTGEGARWERGVLNVPNVNNQCTDYDLPCDSTISEFETSDSTAAAPNGFGLSVAGDRTVSQSGDGAWPAFHGAIGSRKNMIVATWSPTAASRAMTVFQKKGASDLQYTIADLSGTGKTGNGPTLYAYHQLSTGASDEWEYSNCKIGQQGQFWREDLRDVTYWDYSTPTYKVAPTYDFLWKNTSVGIDIDGLVQEYDNYGTHDAVFTGRMTYDKTVVVGVSTRTDARGGNPQHLLRVEQLCFKPADQTLPTYTLSDLAASYKFHRLSATAWAYGTMTITGAGATTFSEYTDSDGSDYSFDGFTLFTYPDNSLNPYPQFANFATAAQDGAPHYHDAAGQPYHTRYDYWTYGGVGEAPELPPLSGEYRAEHGSLSYNKDLFVLTRTDAAGTSVTVALR